jgi:hypothetical protein
MRLSSRIGLERRLAAAEAVVAERVRKRAVALLADEHAAGDWRIQRSIESAMARLAARELAGAETDPIRAVLAEIARSAPAVARRVAAAVGIDLKD